MDKKLLSTPQIMLLLAAFSAVYISGLFIPLMENDSAQHASMAMRMVLENDYRFIFKGDLPYLDKPHLHFWLSALSMKIFGISHVAYRLPALLLLALAAFSTKKLADLLYENENLSYTAVLIFLSSQTIILSAHDVRTDAVLTGFIAFSIWQFVKFIKTQNWQAAIFAGLGAALAFSAKGSMAIVIIGSCILAYLLYAREWSRFFNAKILWAGLAFIMGILPVLYAYHHQFGENGISFILFNQSMDRLNAKGFQETNGDYLFFFHTLLWAFLPFSLAFYFGVVQKTGFFIKNKFRKTEGVEFLTLGGFWLVMMIFSLSKFKLPHYLNGLIAVLAVFTAAYLVEILKKNTIKQIKILYVVQLLIIVSSLLGIALLAYYFTGISNPIMYIVTAVVFSFLVHQIFLKQNLVQKYVWISLLFAAAINLFLNTQFYPVLTQYQGGLKLAKFVNNQQIDKNKIKVFDGNEPWSFDFYTQRNTPRAAEKQLQKGEMLVITKKDLGKLKRKYSIVKVEDHFRITRLSLKFLNSKTRASQLDQIFLIKIED